LIRRESGSGEGQAISSARNQNIGRLRKNDQGNRPEEKLHPSLNSLLLHFDVPRNPGLWKAQCDFDSDQGFVLLFLPLLLR
jgi:hypothetical protein